MSNISTWSTSATANVLAVPNGWPEGQAPSTVNDCAREMMGAIRRQWNDAEWFDWGDTPSRASATTFKITTDVTSRYEVHRRLKMSNGSSTLYGTITDSSYSAPDTTVTMNMDSGSLTSSLTAVALAIISPSNSSLPQTAATSNTNFLINGDFIIAQRGTSFTAATTPANSDDTYLLDRWVLLSDGDDVLDVSQETTAANLPSGSRSGIKLDVETANKKAGILQVIENKNALEAVGETVSLSFKAKKVVGNSTVDKLRAAVISWDSTADSVTSDVVQAWNAEGTDPSLATNWTYENTPADLTLTDAYQTFRIEGISVDTASTTNIGVFIWIDNDDGTAGDLVYITDVHLNIGVASGRFEVNSFKKELANCQRYYSKTFNYSTAAADGAALPGRLMMPMMVANANGWTGVNWSYPVEMRTAPTITLYNPRGAGTAGQFDNGSASLANASTDNIGTSSVLLYDSGGSAATARWYIHAAADAEL